VGAIAVGVGPGSFTGLRVGIASARALGSATGLRVSGVGTLDTRARGIAEAHQARPRLAVLDARRGEAFALLQEPSGRVAWGPWVGAPERLGERLSGLAEPPLAAGSGALRFRDELEKHGVEVLPAGDPAHRVAARHVCAIAAAAPGTPPEPVYLRAPDAERWRERDTSRTAG
jgi:tRNA threonylcarbamoyladenosine biosynthesis protein TsaB